MHMEHGVGLQGLEYLRQEGWSTLDRGVRVPGVTVPGVGVKST